MEPVSEPLFGEVEGNLVIEDIQNLEVEDIKMLDPTALLKALKEYDRLIRPKMAFTKDLEEHHFDSTNLRKLGDMIGKALSGEEHYAVIHWRGMVIKKTEPEYPDIFMDSFYGEYTINMEVHVYEKDKESESSEDS